MSLIHGKLKESLIYYRRLRRMRRHYDELKARQKAENNELAEMVKRLKKEKRDVERLEALSIRGMFLRILGDKEKQLEQERQEYLHLVLNHNELLNSGDLINYEIGLLREKLKDLERAKARYYDLLKTRENQIKRAGETTHFLLELSRRIDDNYVLLDDIEEAIIIGDKAMVQVKRLEKELVNAQNWGHWDMHDAGRSGGGRWKHRALDRASDMIHRARHLVLRFQSELTDVYDDEQILGDLSIEQIDRFFDLFFDNLISDWVVQQKIAKAYRKVRSVRKRLSNALKRLKEDLPATEKIIVEFERERERERERAILNP